MSKTNDRVEQLEQQVALRETLISNLRSDLDRALTAGEKLADDKIERDMQVKELNARVHLLGTMSRLPGIQVKDLRAMLNLGSTGDEAIDEMILNLPDVLGIG